MMTLKAQLLTVSETFAASTSLSESRISTMVFNDGKVLARLRGGADVTTCRFERAMEWFAGNWPSQVDWPAGVSRPTAVEKATP